MKTTFLLALLAGLLYYYYAQDSTAPRPTAENSAAAQSALKAVSPGPIVIAALPSYSERWKTGPNAQTDLKTGPNAQVDFAPFAPSEMANWNRTSGYTIVSGINLRR